MNSSKPLKLQYLVILEAMAFIKQPEMELIYPPWYNGLSEKRDGCGGFISFPKLI